MDVIIIASFDVVEQVLYYYSRTARHRCIIRNAILRVEFIMSGNIYR